MISCFFYATIVLFIVLAPNGAYLQQFLMSKEDQVKAEEFIYYKVVQPGNVLIELESTEGDTDIYISSSNPSPSYNPATYDLHSATCGLDSIIIPANMKRPVAMGIYGHSSHDLSKYTLNIYQMPADDMATEHESLNAESFLEIEETKENRREMKKQAAKNKKKGNVNGIWPLLELFEMLFL